MKEETSMLLWWLTISFMIFTGKY